MKPILCGFLLGLCAAPAAAQVANSSFEQVRDTAATLPQNWMVRRIAGYTVAVDARTAHSGTASLQLTAPEGVPADGFSPFSQIVPVTVSGVKKLSVTVWVKTQDVKDAGGLWCQVWDAADQQIGFKNLEGQGTSLKGTSDWKKYTLQLLVNGDCKKLLLGGYLQGPGTIWYDDFSVEEAAPATAGASKKATRYIADFCTIVKKNSVYTDAIRWDTLDQEVAALSAGASTYADAAEVAGYVLSRLRAVGDEHSFLMPRQQSKEYATGNADPRQPSARLLNEHTGYVYVPGMASTNEAALRDFATQLQAHIRALDRAHTITGWVVDLRENTGGNMYPMIAGLGPLIGDGEAGYFVTNTKKTPWYYKAGRCGAGGSTAVKVKAPYALRGPAPKIAVLIGSHTASSGEMTTLSFVGKPSTRLFGQATAGLTTANGMYPLSDGSTLLLANSYTADRTGRVYKGQVVPDELVTGDGDALAAAERWLHE